MGATAAGETGASSLTGVPSTFRERLTGVPSTFRERPDRRDLIEFAAGVALLGCLVVVDVLLGEDQSIAGAFVLPPLLLALSGSVRATTALALVALITAVASGGWNMQWGDAAHLARSAVVLLGGVIAVAAAVARRRALLDERRLELLNGIGAIADGTLPLDQTLDRLTRLVVPTLADICIVDAITVDGMSRLAVRSAGVPDRDRVEGRIRDRRPSVPAYLRESGRGGRPASHFVPRADDAALREIAHNAGEDLRFIRSLDVCSFMFVPLYARGRTLATLTLITTRHSGRSLGEADVRFAEVMSGRIALALDNAGLFSDLESVERRLDAVMNLIGEAVIVHDAEQRIVFANAAAARWFSSKSVAELLDSPEAALERVRFRDEAGTAMGPTSEVLVPSEAGEPRSALLRVERPGADEAWAEVRFEPIRTTEGELLFGVTTVHDVTSIKRAEFAMTVLSETAGLLDSTRDLRLTLEAIAALAVPQFADFCSVHLPDEDGVLAVAAVAHFDADREQLVRRLQLEHPIRVGDDRATSVAFREGEPVLLEIDEDYLSRAGDDARGQLLRLLDVRSVLIVPLTAGGNVVGVLTYANHRESRRFDVTDAALGAEIGARAGLAVENARLTTEEAEIAELLQLGLRPTPLPVMSGWDVAAMYRSAGEVTEVGGDFYDAFRIDGGWVLAIGDVVGHGAAAASLTALARYTLRTAATVTNDAEEALRRLHEAISELGRNEMCSVALVVLPDCGDDTAEISVLSAGHPLPLHLSAGGRRVREVGTPGPLLGVFESPSWPSDRVSLEPGDQLILYTDGVPEAKGRDQRFGSARLRSSLSGSTDATSAVRSVETALDEFCPSGGEDDAALVAIQRLPRPARPASSATDDAAQRRPRAGVQPASG
jgi:serine phosphatase RsbU (regulator of sigma subunit)/PAS domain-containing protein